MTVETRTLDRLDEPSHRRPTFTPGVPITLSDGQSWHFAPPVLEFLPVFGDDGSIKAGVCTDIGPEFDAAVEAYESAVQATQAGDQIAASKLTDLMMGLAVRLLLASYDLDHAQLERLLGFRPADPENLDRWGQIILIARGQQVEPPSTTESSSGEVTLERA
jgi:hypothetical protein